MRWALIIAILTCAAVFAGNAPQTFSGEIVDVQCVKAPAGETKSPCAVMCPLVKGIRYTLQTDEEAFVLTDQKAAARYAGHKVIVKGTLTPSNRLKVLSIVPAGH